MIIQEINIDNFGKLHHFHYTFNASLNEIYQENGYGKTTIGTFIKCMLYGFEGENIRKEDAFNEKREYTPWQGGKYGGSITFKIENNTYQLVRDFNNKKKDCLYELPSMKISKKYSLENIGKEILGISGPSFTATLFTSQNHYTAGAIQDIDAKISNLESLDLGNYDQAIKSLQSQKEVYTKKKSGKIDVNSNRIQKINQIILYENSYISSLNAKEIKNQEDEESLKNFKERVSQLNQQRESIVKKQAELLDIQQYQTLVEKVNETKKELDEELEYFHYQSIDPIELNQSGKLAQSGIVLENQIASEQLSDTEKEQLEKLSKTYEHKDLYHFDYSLVMQKLDQLDQYKEIMESNSLSVREKEAFEQDSVIFKNHPVDLDEIHELMNKVKNRNANSQKPLKQSGVSPLVIIGVILIISGVIVMNMVNQIAGLLIIGIGSILLGIGYGLRSKENNEDYIENQVMIRSIDANVSDYLKKYNIEYDPFICYAQLSDLEDRYMNYLENLKQIEQANQSDASNKYHSLKEELLEFYQYYSDASIQERELRTAFYYLNEEIETYHELTQRYQKYENDFKQLKDKNEKLQNYFDQYGIKIEENAISTVQSMKRHYEEMLENQKKYQAAKEEKESFEKEHPEYISYPKEIVESTDLNEIDEKISSYLSNIQSIQQDLQISNQEIENLNNRLSEIEEAKKELADLQADLIRNQKQAELLDQTIQLLEKAKQSFNEKYANSYLNRMQEYLNLLTNEEVNYIVVDDHKQIHISENGMLYSKKLLSQGYQDLVELCLRFALIEAMYENEKPIIILDDPLINLDEKKITKGIELIHHLASKYQVIYMTCHQDRL